jgi:hypothetical protein
VLALETESEEVVVEIALPQPPEQGYLRGIEVVSALFPLNRTSFLSESMSTSPS